MWKVEVWGSICSSLEGPSLILFMISQKLAGWCNKLLKVKILTWIKNGNQLLVVEDIIHALSSFHVLGRFPHLLNPAIPSVSGYLLQARIQLYAKDIGPNIPLWDLSLGKSNMKKEMLTRLCVEANGVEMVIFQKPLKPVFEPDEIAKLQGQLQS